MCVWCVIFVFIDRDNPISSDTLKRILLQAADNPSDAADAGVEADTLPAADGDADAEAEELHVHHLFSNADGVSQFADILVPLPDGGPAGFLSETFLATGVQFRFTDGTYDLDLHPAPARQFM